MLRVKRNTDTNTRKTVRNMSDLLSRNTMKNLELLLSYTIKSYSNKRHQEKIVQFVSFECHFNQGGDIRHVVEKLFALGALLCTCL